MPSVSHSVASVRGAILHICPSCCPKRVMMMHHEQTPRTTSRPETARQRQWQRRTETAPRADPAPYPARPPPECFRVISVVLLRIRLSLSAPSRLGYPIFSTRTHHHKLRRPLHPQRQEWTAATHQSHQRQSGGRSQQLPQVTVPPPRLPLPSSPTPRLLTP